MSAQAVEHQPPPQHVPPQQLQHLPLGPGTAPGRLAVVQAFANTATGAGRADALASPRALGHWLQERGLLGLEEDLREPVELARGRAVRDALRETMRRPHDGRGAGPCAPTLAARRVLDCQAARSRMTVVAGTAGALLLEPRAGGLDGALGRLLAVAVRAQADGTWTRLTVCAGETCRWAFWDSSRARTARWCSLATCTSRAPVPGPRSRATDPELPLWA